MIAYRCGGGNGEQLVESAYASGQGNGNIAVGREDFLAVAQVVAGNLHIRIIADMPVLLNYRRHHTDGAPAGIVAGAGNVFHQSHVAAAEHERMAVAPHPLAELARLVEICFVDVVVRAAEYSYVHNR